MQLRFFYIAKPQTWMSVLVSQWKWKIFFQDSNPQKSWEMKKVHWKESHNIERFYSLRNQQGHWYKSLQKIWKSLQKNTHAKIPGTFARLELLSGSFKILLVQSFCRPLWKLKICLRGLISIWFRNFTFMFRKIGNF